jgi:hypothetical protein
VRFVDGLVRAPRRDGIADRLDAGPALAQRVVEPVLGVPARRQHDPVGVDLELPVGRVDVEQVTRLASMPSTKWSVIISTPDSYSRDWIQMK